MLHRAHINRYVAFNSYYIIQKKKKTQLQEFNKKGLEFVKLSRFLLKDFIYQFATITLLLRAVSCLLKKKK